jgi:hypothetical protein
MVEGALGPAGLGGGAVPKASQVTEDTLLVVPS